MEQKHQESDTMWGEMLNNNQLAQHTDVEALKNMVRENGDVPEVVPEEQLPSHIHWCSACENPFWYNGHGCPLNCPICGAVYAGDCH